MEFEDVNQYHRLKSKLNNTKYMGNTLKIDLAKLCWQEKWKMENEDFGLAWSKKKQLLQIQWKNYKKMTNIQKSWRDRKNVIAGRLRKTPRSKYRLKDVSFRVNVNGQLKTYKCYKTKLWGYERNKPLADLVFRFSNNYWRDANGHILDKLDFSKSKVCCLSLLQRAQSVKHIDEEKAEQERNSDVLNGILTKFDVSRPKAEKLEDSRNDTNTISDELPNINSESEEEPMPNFGTSQLTHPNGREINDTEKLRDLFNPRDHVADKFKLSVVENDDETLLAHHESIEGPDLSSLNRSKGLFFPHFGSPFLYAQTEFAKFDKATNTGNYFDSWEETFWNNRAVWNREMKLKKRDALRKHKHRQSNIEMISYKYH